MKHTISDVEEIEQILYAPNLNITQKEYSEFIDEVVPKILTTLTTKHAEELEKAYDIGKKDGHSEEYNDGYFHGHLAGKRELEKAVEAERERLRPILKCLDVIGYPPISSKEYQEMIDIALTPTKTDKITEV